MAYYTNILSLMEDTSWLMKPKDEDELAEWAIKNSKISVEDGGKNDYKIEFTGSKAAADKIEKQLFKMSKFPPIRIELESAKPEVKDSIDESFDISLSSILDTNLENGDTLAGLNAWLAGFGNKVYPDLKEPLVEFNAKLESFGLSVELNVANTEWSLHRDGVVKTDEICIPLMVYGNPSDFNLCVTIKNVSNSFMFDFIIY